MSIDLSTVQSEDGKGAVYRLGLDNEKVASLLEQLAANVRASNVIPKQIEITSVFTSDEWEAGRLTFNFHEKVQL